MKKSIIIMIAITAIFSLTAKPSYKKCYDYCDQYINCVKKNDQWVQLSEEKKEQLYIECRKGCMIFYNKVSKCMDKNTCEEKFMCMKGEYEKK